MAKACNYRVLIQNDLIFNFQNCKNSFRNLNNERLCSNKITMVHEYSIHMTSTVQNALIAQVDVLLLL